MVLPIYFFFCILHITYSVREEPRPVPAEEMPKVQDDPAPRPPIPSIDLDMKPEQHIQATVIEVKPPNSVNKTAAKSNKTTELAQLPVINKLTPNFKKSDLFESGAMLRAFYVLLGATFLLMLYLGFRMFRLRRGSKPPSMVMKYGVLTRREDSEILPLPLSEDDDDDNTVFELNSVNR